MSEHLDRDEVAGLAMLAPEDPLRAVADAHARGCEPCRAALEEASATLSALDALAPPPPPSADALARARDAVLAEMREAAPARGAPTREEPELGAMRRGPEPELAGMRHTPEPELSVAANRARTRAAVAIPALSIAAFVALALALRPIAEVAWVVSLGLVAIVAGRTALALVRGTPRDAGFSLALGVGASIALVMVDADGGGDTHGMRCVAVELAAAALPLLAAAFLAWRGALRASALSFAAIATSGALAGQLALRATCPDHDLDHLAAFHLGGVLASALAGAIVSRLPALRAA